jgi:ribosomal protein S18 acetylase RimI-like enzyme
MPSSSSVIEPYSTSTIRSLGCSDYAAAMTLLMDRFPKANPAEFRYYLCSQPQGFRLLVVDGQLAGLALLQTHPGSDELWLNVIAVAVGQQRRGIAQRLLTQCEREAAERGLTALGLRCDAANERALRLYDRRGYGRVRETFDSAQERR